MSLVSPRLRTVRQLSTSVAGLRRPKQQPKVATTRLAWDEQEPEPEVMTMDTATHIKNFALATCLLGFCVGVARYSMNAVGQAGTDPSDPLSALKLEAAVAQRKQDQEAAKAAQTADMIRQAENLDLELDGIEDEDQLNERSKPWWKFW